MMFGIEEESLHYLHEAELHAQHALAHLSNLHLMYRSIFIAIWTCLLLTFRTKCFSR